MSLSFTIIETRESEAHKRTSHNARTSWRAANPGKTRYNGVATTFVCIDGEGITLPDGMHKYVLLGIGAAQISNPDGLTWEECAGFLWEQFLAHGTRAVAYTGFFLAYDFVQWLRTLPENRARMLLTATGRQSRQPKSSKRVQPFPVRYAGWEFDILGTKRFRLRREGHPRWMVICDTGPFFQKSFLAVIDPKEWSEPVVSPEEYETVSRGKSRRNTAILDDNMRYYNALENEIHSRVLSRLESGFAELGIHLRPGQWFGPGQAAQSWLTSRAITSKRLQDVTPHAVLAAATASYYGGWFEIMAHGIIPGATWEYDINSAYPHIIRSLPCLEHGKWSHHDGPVPGPALDSHALVRARVHGSDPYIGAMLHRDESGNISRPHDTEGWYWLAELVAAQSAGIINTVDVSESWTYQPCLCPPPLSEVAEIYQLRQRAGKKTPVGMACKYCANSLYGKFAQSIGSPKFGNPIYASLITSGCRTIDLNAIATHTGGTRDVLMVATDGVYFRTRHDSLPVSSNLGAWEENQRSNMLLFKPGVYWDDTTRETIAHAAVCVDEACSEPHSPVFKARGVNARDFGASLGTVDALFRTLASHRDTRISWPEVTFPVSFSMVTALQALQRGNWELAGTLIPDPSATQSSDPRLKRCSWYWDNDILRSKPVINSPYHASTPYEKRFGIDDPWSQENQEENGVAPDGYPGWLWKEVLYGD